MVAMEWKALVPSISEIKTVAPEHIEIFTTDKVVSTLRDLKVFFGRSNNRFKPENTILMKLAGSTEPYSCYPVGRWIYSMGAFSYSETPLPPEVKIGRYCSIAVGLDLFGVRHPLEWVSSSSVFYDNGPKGYRSFATALVDFKANLASEEMPANYLASGPVIEHDVWIGRSAFLARGIRLGTGCVVGAGAVVTKDVPPYAIVGGNPARIIRYRFTDNIIARLLSSEWWRYDPTVFLGKNFQNPEAFLDAFEAVNNAVPYEPKPIDVGTIVRALANATTTAAAKTEDL